MATFLEELTYHRTNCDGHLSFAWNTCRSWPVTKPYAVQRHDHGDLDFADDRPIDHLSNWNVFLLFPAWTVHGKHVGNGQELDRLHKGDFGARCTGYTLRNHHRYRNTCWL